MPVVEHLDGVTMAIRAECYLNPGTGRGIFEHVGQRFVDDAIDGQVHAGGKISRYIVERERHVQTSLIELVDQRRNVGDSWSGTEPVDFGFPAVAL